MDAQKFEHIKIDSQLMMAFAQLYSRKEKLNSKFSEKTKRKKVVSSGGSFKSFKVNETYLEENCRLRSLKVLENKEVISHLRSKLPFKKQGEMH